MLKYILNPLNILLSLLFLASACVEEEVITDQDFSSDNFSVLKVSEGDNRIEAGESGISAFQLKLDLVFSHAVEPTEIEENLSISGDAQYSVSYDSSNSVATLSFDALEYETEYTLNLPAGTYGANGESTEEEFSFNFTTSPFITPVVTLSTDNESPEEGTSTTITANLSESTTADVKVEIEVSGTATSGEDFVLAETEIIVPIGETSASITLDIIDDEVAEGAESIEVRIVSIENGKNEEPEPLIYSIVDNDVFTDLELKGAFALRWSTEPSGNSGKAVHLRATADIADLSVYSIGVANNGGGSDSIEYTFPEMAVAAGEDVLLAREPDALLTYLGNTASTEFEHVIQTDAMNQNGDDAIELFSGTAVIQTYGDVNVDGTDMSWEYKGSWAYSVAGEWRTGGVDCAASSTSTQNSPCIYPLIATDLLFKGAMEIDTDAGLRIRAYHFEALEDISDLSPYKIEIYNNGTTSLFRTIPLPAESAIEGEEILVVRDADVEDVGPYFGGCSDRFTIYESGDVTSNGDDALVYYENEIKIDTLGVVGVDGTGEAWEYANSYGYRTIPGADFDFPGAGCTDAATSNADASCFYPACE